MAERTFGQEELADMFYEEDVKRLNPAFDCGNCEETVYETHEYIDFEGMKICGEDCLMAYLEANNRASREIAEKSA